MRSRYRIWGGSVGADMGRALGAVAMRDAEVDDRLDRLEDTIEANRGAQERDHKDLVARLESLGELIGKAPEAAGGPTGMYKLISNLDARVRPFEAWRHRVVGGVAVAGPLLIGFGTILYFLEGSRLHALFAH